MSRLDCAPGPHHCLSTCLLAKGMHTRGGLGEGAGRAGLSLCWSKRVLATGLSSEGVCSSGALSFLHALFVARPGGSSGRAKRCQRRRWHQAQARHVGQRPRCPLWQPGPGLCYFLPGSLLPRPWWRVCSEGHVGSMRHGVGPASSSEGHTGQESQHSTLAQPDRPTGGAGPPTSQMGTGGGGLLSRARRAQGRCAPDRQMARPPQVDFLK